MIRDSLKFAVLTSIEILSNYWTVFNRGSIDIRIEYLYKNEQKFYSFFLQNMYRNSKALSIEILSNFRTIFYRQPCRMCIYSIEKNLQNFYSVFYRNSVGFFYRICTEILKGCLQKFYQTFGPYSIDNPVEFVYILQKKTYRISIQFSIEILQVFSIEYVQKF